MNEAEIQVLARQAKEALTLAVAEALEKKHRLGQYAIIVKDGKVVRVPPEDIPKLLEDDER